MKNLFLSAAVIFSFTLFSCGTTEEKKQNDAVKPDTSKGVSAMKNDSAKSELAYVCPCGGCPEVKEAKPGNCPKCGLELVKEKKK
ncbi:MAG: hypothetical protein HY063_09490 [Bacteroidetes bacterium]|nr:hypothetical protein [Bacteroidota bacterium]